MFIQAGGLTGSSGLSPQVPDERETGAAAQRRPTSGVVCCCNLGCVNPLLTPPPPSHPVPSPPLPSPPSSPPPTRLCTGRHEHSNHAGSHYTRNVLHRYGCWIRVSSSSCWYLLTVLHFVFDSQDAVPPKYTPTSEGKPRYCAVQRSLFCLFYFSVHFPVAQRNTTWLKITWLLKLKSATTPIKPGHNIW